MKIQRWLLSPLLALAVSQASAAPPDSGALPVLEVSSFPSPGTSFWFSQLIPKLGLDKKHGFKLVVNSKSSQAAYADFVSGASKVCYCIATAAAARFVERGANISQVWINEPATLVIVTKDPKIRTPKDLEGRSLGSDTVTGAWAISAALLKHQGVNLDKVKLQSGSFTKVISELLLGRLDAVALEKSTLNVFLPKDPEKYTVISLTDSDSIREATDGHGVPMWGLGAWNDWLEVPGNQALLRALYAASQELAARISADVEWAAGEISQLTKQDRSAIHWELKTYWKNTLAPARTYEKGIRLLGSELLPKQKIIDRPLVEDDYRKLISTLKL